MSQNRELSDVITSATPEQAAENIHKAQAQNLKPDNYVELKEEYDNVPPEKKSLPRYMAEVVEESTQHRAVMDPDIAKLSALDRQVRYTGLVLEGVDLSKELNELTVKELHGVDLAIEDKLRIVELNRELQELGGRQEKYGYGFTESFAPEVGGGLYDFGTMVKNQYPLVLKTAGAGAVGGALAGIPGGIPGMIAGATAMGTMGAGTGLTAAFMIQGYIDAAGPIYNELRFNSEEAKDMPEQTKKNIAIGGGVLSGAASILVSKAVVKSNPFFQKLLNPKAFAKHVASPKGAGLRKAIGRLFSTVSVSEALEESVQESVQIIAEKLGETYDGSETSLIAALDAAYKDPETLPRIGKSAALGGTVGKVVDVGLKVATAPFGVKRENYVEQSPIAETVPVQVQTTAKGIKALQLQYALQQTLNVTKDTNTKQMLPEKMDEIRQKAYENAGTSDVFIDPDELKAWAKDDAKLAKVLEAIGPDGIAASEVNSPIRVEVHKFLKLAEEHPDITNLVKTSPETLSAGAHIDKLTDADQKRAKIIGELGQDPDAVEIGMKPAVEKHLNALNKKRRELVKELKDNPDEQKSAQLSAIEEEIAVNDQRIADIDELILLESRLKDGEIKTEESYLEQPTFTKDMEEVLPAKEIQDLNEAETLSRVEVADKIREDITAQKVKDLKVRVKEEQAAKRKKMEDESYENMNLVDDFLNNAKVIGKPAPWQKKLMQKKIPVHSIDPDSLKQRIRTKYEDDPVLKKRKVFRKGGMKAGDVAQLHNQPSVEALLKTLANSPTREQQIQSELDNLKQNMLEDPTNTEIDESDLAQKYDKKSNWYLKTGEKLRTLYWPKFRQGIKRIANDIPALQRQLDQRARDVVGNTRVKNLNLTQWNMGAERSKRKAVDSYLKGRLEEGFSQSQNAAFANQVAKQTAIANRKVNRAFKFLTSLSQDPKKMNELVQAGQEYVDAAKYYTDLFNFNPKDPQQLDDDKFRKYLKRLDERGERGQKVHPLMAKRMTPRQSANDLTVDQVLFIEEKLRTLLHHARLKNKLLRKDENRTIEMIAKASRETALTNPKYDRNRNFKMKSVVPGTYGFVANVADSLESLITNNQYIIQELDQNKLGGFYANILHFPITGVGGYSGPTGLVARSKLAGEVSRRTEKVIKKHYGSVWKFRQLSVETVVIPELSHIFPKGKVAKSDALMLLANLGNASNRKYVENFGVDPDVIRERLTKVLKKRDFDYVQEGMLDAFKTLAPRIKAVHKATTGIDLDMIEPESFEAFGTTYEGGYFPVMLDVEVKGEKQEVDLVREQIANLSKPQQQDQQAYGPAYEGIVRSPHTKERNGSEYTLTLNMDRFSRALDEVIHDVTMREPVRDVMVLASDPDIKEDIISQIGKIKYDTFMNNVMRLTKSIDSNSIRLHNNLQSMITGVAKYVQSGFAINQILFNVGSIAMSPMALPQVMLKMGPKNFAKYGVQVALEIAGSLGTLNLRAFSEAYRIAAEIDPSLQSIRQNLNDTNFTVVGKLMPNKRLIKSKPYDALKQMQEGIVQAGFDYTLGAIDTIIKTFTTVAVYKMYINGDAEGHSYQKVHEGKTLEQIDRDAKAYASQFLENTTMRGGEYDKAPLQNIPGGHSFTMFWNESRNTLNNTLGQGRQVKRRFGDAKRAVKDGDLFEANIAFRDTGSKIMTMWLVMVVSDMIYNVARYGDPFIIKDDEEEDPRDQDGDFFKYAEHTMLHPVDLATGFVGGNTPVARDFLFSKDSAEYNAIPRQNVSVPLFNAGTDIAAASNLPSVILQDLQDGMDLLESLDELSDQEQKALLKTLGYATKGFIPGGPQLLKLRQNIENGETELPDVNVNAVPLFIKAVDAFVEARQPDKDAVDAAQKRIDANEGTFEDHLIRDLKEIRNSLAPRTEEEVLSGWEYEIIKHAESNGQWDATPEKGTAFGPYQFTEGTWDDLMKTPEGIAAGLTEAGRTLENGQQEIGMRILTRDNARQLAKKGVPVNIETLYFTHHFGPAYADFVYNKADDMKLPSGLLKKKVVENNPQLKHRVKTVGDMKIYIKRALVRGERSLTKSRGGKPLTKAKGDTRIL